MILLPFRVIYRNVTPKELVRFVEKKMNFQKHDLDEYSELMGEMLNVSSISLIKV